MPFKDGMNHMTQFCYCQNSHSHRSTDKCKSIYVTICRAIQSNYNREKI